MCLQDLDLHKDYSPRFTLGQKDRSFTFQRKNIIKIKLYISGHFKKCNVHHTSMSEGSMAGNHHMANSSRYIFPLIIYNILSPISGNKNRLEYIIFPIGLLNFKNSEI